MIQDRFQTGMYVVDGEFRIINVNEAMHALYPNVKVGDTCYRAIALQERQCAVCPLCQDEVLFYNPLRREWINANAAAIDYPDHGRCYAVQFHVRANLSEIGQESLQEEDMSEHIIELSGGTLDACAIGSYCEPGAPLSYVNEQLVELMGYDSVEEMRNAVDGLVFNTIHPDDVERVTADLTECGLNGGYFETNYRLRRKDHTWLGVVARGKRVQMASGVYVLFCVLTDMSKFVHRQIELQQENEALMQRGRSAEAALTHMPSGYHRCGAEEGGPFRFVSRSFEQIVGYTWEQLRDELDNLLINLLFPEDLPRLRRMQEDVLKKGNGDAVYRIRRRDGEIRWVQNSCMALDWDGETCLQCTIADITDFINQQAELVQQNAELELNAQNIPCGYHLCSVDNGFHLEFVSDSFGEIMGYARDELLGKRFIDFVYEEDRAFFMDHEPMLEKEGKVELVYRIVRKDGVIRWVKDYTTRIRLPDRETYQVILADITEYVEELKEAKERAEASNQAKSTFLFNASHDIRTPMNAIKGFAHIIADHADQPEMVRETVRKLQRSSDVLLTLMDDVLELSRIEQGRDPLNVQPLNMQMHVEKLYEMMAHEMEAHGITFRVENHIEHPMVMADELKLTRIAMNYLSNARKFTPAGGTVTFGVTESGYDGHQAVYTLVVQDTGIGMSKEFQAHAFEQFEREQTSTASGVSGSGLGLSITRKLAGLLGGTCTMESELGKGTKMICSVPLLMADERELHVDAAPSVQDFTGMRLLLVEDNEFNREIARYVLEDVGFCVEEAVNGVECLEKLTCMPADTFDLVLMDVQMPIMDGYTATVEIRRFKDPAIRNIPIIAMTANAFDEDKKHCLSIGMDGHIAKPMDAQVVLAELSRVLTKGGGR